MHWAGVSTVGVQSEQVVIQSLSQVHISNVYPAALGALAYKSDIGTKGHSVNLFRILPVRNSHSLSRVYRMLTLLDEAQSRRIACYPIAS
jgi:hypothetical protein